MLTWTTTQILDSLHDSKNTDIWLAFDQRYRPVLVAFARQRGLSEEDAADVAQTTLAEFVSDYRAGKYDRSRGRLSSWIIGIASNRIADIGRMQKRRGSMRGQSGFVDVAADDAEKQWDESLRRVVLERALAMLRLKTRLDPRTIAAFELCSIRGVPAEAAAAECGMTAAEVYVAKNRVIQKLRTIVAELTQEYDEP